MLDVQIRKRLATGRKRGDSFSLDVSLSCATSSSAARADL